MGQFEQSAALVDEALHDLKLRFELLGFNPLTKEGDRKAYYETSQWAIRRNKEEVNNLRLQNKHLSDAISRIKKSELDSHSSRLSMTELEIFDHKICEIQKKLDEIMAEARLKEKKLWGLVDQLSDISREAEMVNANMKDSPQAKEIRMLENRLDKAMIKYNETQSIKKTYELIVKRLQEERLTFDIQLANFEKGLKSKKQDASELDMMSRDANHAKEVAKVI
jgi:tRNA G10  N-methylase Trm11